MKFIKILIVLVLMFLLFKVYTGISSKERDIGIDAHRKIYKKTEDKLNKATEIQKQEYEKLKKTE
jgi:hypothetical protein